MRRIILCKPAFLIISLGSPLFVSEGMIGANHPAHLTSAQPGALQKEIIKTTVESDFLVLSRAIRRGDRMHAIMDRLASKANLLIIKGAEVNTKAKNGDTALKLAIEANFVPIIDSLRMAGAK